MNLLSLRLDKTRKLRLWRFWYHTREEIGFGLAAVAIFGAAVAAALAYGLWPR